MYAGTVEDYVAPDDDVIAIIERLSPGSTLDIGCGAGGLVIALANRG